MSSTRPPGAPARSASSSRSRSAARSRAYLQTSVDADLNAEFEAQGIFFDYSRSTSAPRSTPPAARPTPKVIAYLQQIQRSKLIQPFGCVVAAEERTFKIIAFSENAVEMLGMSAQSVPSVTDRRPEIGFGVDVRALFSSPGADALHKAVGYADVSLLNPVLVHSKASGRPFYAILHRATGCLVIDLEAVTPAELPVTAAGALQSYKLAAKAIGKLQSLPGGSIKRLCDTVVREVFELTGYDRVMAYRFHEDDHGEVFAEVTKPGLKPFLGLHYPATDIPQAARFLFTKNKARMICDCRAAPVRVLQDDACAVDVSLCGSTLRAPHSCHMHYMENMKSIASLVLAVVINENDEESSGGSEAPAAAAAGVQRQGKRLWGLVVCHHESPRFVPFPLRYACEFLVQVTAVHVKNEIELENQVREKNILKTQALLCDMLLREADAGPLSILSGSPSVMDLVRCDGAALLYHGQVRLLGRTPTEQEIKKIAAWLSERHAGSTGLSTDSLLDAGYPGAEAISDIACGMAAAWISSKDILFWFRTPHADEVRWGGAKHDPNEEDDGMRIHPRVSFQAFLEIVRGKSRPWSDDEMDAVHSLQLILRGVMGDVGGNERSSSVGQVSELGLDSVAKLQAVTSEMVRLIETATVPILAVDGGGVVNGWNQKIADLTGLPVDEALGQHLLTLVDEPSLPAVQRMLSLALQGGVEEHGVQFQLRTHGARRGNGPVALVVNACASRDAHGVVVGACFMAQVVTAHKSAMDRFTRIEGDYKAIIQNPNPLIPPILGADASGCCSEWNAAMAKLSGWDRHEVIGKMLLGEVFGDGRVACCGLRSRDAFVNLSIAVNKAMAGGEAEKSPFGFVNRNGSFVDCILSVTKRVDGDDAVTGVFCFLQVVSQELKQALQLRAAPLPAEQASTSNTPKSLAYIRQAMTSPLSGILYARKMLEATNLTDEQRRLIELGASCHRQLSKILLDGDVDSNPELEKAEFAVREALMAATSQVMMKAKEKLVPVSFNIPEEVRRARVFGDRIRLQQVISEFLAVAVGHCPSGGVVEIAAGLTEDNEQPRSVALELRISYTDDGVSQELLSQMFGASDDMYISDEGLSLQVCRKLLRMMNGEVNYLRDESFVTFIMSIKLPSAL